MNIAELKEYIFENNKIEYVLEKIGCHSISYHSDKDYYSCANYDGDNVTAINVKNNKYLNCVNWTRQKYRDYFNEKADLITLVKFNREKQLNQKIRFSKIIEYIHSLLDLPFSYENMCKDRKEENKLDPLAIFKRVKYHDSSVDVADIKFLDEDVLKDFVPYIHIDIFREGVTKQAIDKFGLGYSFRMSRTIFPFRYWLTGERMGYTGRTSIENYSLFGIPKYFITPNYRKQINLYGLWENIDEIEKAGYITVFESEKSVVKRYSRCDKTCVAVSGHSISDEQVRIVLGLDINEVILAFDKDVDINEIRFLCSKFYRIRKVSYIYDKYDLLGEKDSPADTNLQIYDFLFKYRTVYDEGEHRQYLQSVERK